MHKTAFFLALALLAGCGRIANPEQSEPKNVRVMLFGSKAWNAVFQIEEGGTIRYTRGSGNDSTGFDLGQIEVGGTFTMATGKGWYEFYKHPDSILVVIGRDSTVTYWPEGMEKVYTVGVR